MGRLVGCQNSQFENVFTGLSTATAARNKVGTWVDWLVVKTLFENVFTGLSAAKVGTWVDC